MNRDRLADLYFRSVTEDKGAEMGKAAIATIVGYVSLGVAAIGWILH